MRNWTETPTWSLCCCCSFDNQAPAGKVALVRRGSCNYTDKAQTLAETNAAGMLVFNNEPGGNVLHPLSRQHSHSQHATHSHFFTPCDFQPCYNLATMNNCMALPTYGTVCSHLRCTTAHGKSQAPRLIQCQAPSDCRPALVPRAAPADACSKPAGCLLIGGQDPIGHAFPLFALSLSDQQGAQLLAAARNGYNATIWQPAPGAFDLSEVIIWALAVGTAVGGSLWAGADYQAELAWLSSSLAGDGVRARPQRPV